MSKKTTANGAVAETLKELTADSRVHGEILRRLERKVDDIVGAVEKNTGFRLGHAGEVRIIYWVVGFVCIPVFLLVLDNIVGRF